MLLNHRWLLRFPYRRPPEMGYLVSHPLTRYLVSVLIVIDRTSVSATEIVDQFKTCVSDILRPDLRQPSLHRHMFQLAYDSCITVISLVLCRLSMSPLWYYFPPAYVVLRKMPIDPRSSVMIL